MAVQRRQFRSPIPLEKSSSPEEQSVLEGEYTEHSPGKRQRQFFNGPLFPGAQSPSVVEPWTIWQQPPLSPQQSSLSAWKRRRQQQKPRGKWRKRWVRVVALIAIVAVVFASQGNGEAGAWTADALRAVLGPTITAQIESWYLGITKRYERLSCLLSADVVLLARLTDRVKVELWRW